MRASFQKNWKLYLIEGWALGIFMIVASTVVILLEHPVFHLTDIIPSALIRRILIALAMGLTAIALIYSSWGKLSGAHMNPAVTLANYQLNRITLADAIWYIIFQCMGSVIAMLLYSFLFKNFLSYPSVNFVVTQPGSSGIFAAACAEFFMAFIMFLMVLISSNSKYAAYTGYFAGVLVFLFIGLEAPISGMSINPARSLGSAISSAYSNRRRKLRQNN